MELRYGVRIISALAVVFFVRTSSIGAVVTDVYPFDNSHMSWAIKKLDPTLGIPTAIMVSLTGTYFLSIVANNKTATSENVSLFYEYTSSLYVIDPAGWAGVDQLDWEAFDFSGHANLVAMGNPSSSAIITDNIPLFYTVQLSGYLEPTDGPPFYQYVGTGTYDAHFNFATEWAEYFTDPTPALIDYELLTSQFSGSLAVQYTYNPVPSPDAVWVGTIFLLGLFLRRVKHLRSSGY